MLFIKSVNGMVGRFRSGGMLRERLDASEEVECFRGGGMLSGWMVRDWLDVLEEVGC